MHSGRQELLNLAQIREVFRLQPDQIDHRLADGNFVPARHVDGEDCWDAAEVWSWLAREYPDLAAAAPLRYWPTCSSPVYAGARALQGCVVTDWLIEGVRLRLLWPQPFSRPWPSAGEAAALEPAVQRVYVPGSIGFAGPILHAYGADGELRDGDEPSWRDLAAILGGKAPYWPNGLRDTETMKGWRPGDPPAHVISDTVTDLTAILRLAAIVAEGSPAHRVLIAFARTLQAGSSRSAADDAELVVGEGRDEWVTLAATSAAVPEPAELDEATERAGWLEIMSRTDSLAHKAVGVSLAVNGGPYLPYSQPATVDPASRWGGEWAARLKPAEGGSPAFALVRGAVGTAGIVRYLTDPETDAPAVALDNGNIVTAVPQRLPATSPLAEIILDQPVWVRVADGTLYPAPLSHFPSISWGYAGTGPNALALLTNRLLADVNAPGVNSLRGGGAGLEALFQTGWPGGTVFSRAELEKARDQ